MQLRSTKYQLELRAFNEIQRFFHTFIKFIQYFSPIFLFFPQNLFWTQSKQLGPLTGELSHICFSGTYRTNSGVRFEGENAVRLLRFRMSFLSMYLVTSSRHLLSSSFKHEFWYFGFQTNRQFRQKSFKRSPDFSNQQLVIKPVYRYKI
ncbi:Hypothetical_protein [Hexamita inflata]|uniref:Hypothetical_protein n=1 Tax=Hexamita inflata TaxID=28002 RepID=A0AA86PPJ5_9EUKA|nr:Hypothetical protein HINF_LOCUS30011 [Hexamita inflata]